MCQGKMHSVHRSGKRVVVSVIKLITLRCHSGVPHDNIRIIMQSKMNLMSGKRTFENRQFTVVVECVSGCISSTLLAFLGKNTKQLLPLLRIKGMVVVYQAENCTHINRPPLS